MAAPRFDSRIRLPVCGFSESSKAEKEASWKYLFHIKTREGLDQQEYQKAFERMLELVSESPGFVSIEGFTGEDGSELAVARFELQTRSPSGETSPSMSVPSNVDVTNSSRRTT